MPGPILRLAASPSDSSDFSVFESCDDIQEAWGGVLNGNFSAESIYHDCSGQDGLEPRNVRVNGDPASSFTVRIKVPEQPRAAPARPEHRTLHTSAAVRERRAEAHSTRVASVKEDQEDMEDEMMEEGVESLNIPVVSASLSVDLTTSLTRQKISSVQRGPTLTYADHDDAEESPTRRPRPFTHASESIDVGTPLHHLRASPSTPTSPTSPTYSTSPSSPTSPTSALARQAPISPSFAHRGKRVSRNPSYHFAVRDASFATPVATPHHQSSDKGSRSCDSSPIRPQPQMEPLREDASSVDGSSQRRHASESDSLIPIPLPVNMSRSVSFSGQELLAPTTAASGSLSEGNSRSGSVPQLSSSPTHSTSAPTLDTKLAPPNFTRGSVISRSFRRLFSTPSRTPPPQPEECWDDIPGVQITSEAEVKSSRLKRIGSSFSRKLTSKPKMSGGSGSNGQPLVVPNGTTTPTSPEDARSLVEYEDLLKLFCCSGCQSFMVPPLHQCRKGHLVCNSCRFSLKQACPTCKQRFADSTNLMMEQVSLPRLSSTPTRAPAVVLFFVFRARGGQVHLHPPLTHLPPVNTCTRGTRSEKKAVIYVIL
ncbi:E3 ubiquitin-protein ligase sina [Portunus trituberculatus]|uniref:E3 ubiquitin-protein ligase sina n=1 Tax=Portunus trituberculatus TaxID=210409 RepID=A0A5B7FJ24_PORTR|nr:E3 ubiquitin-protein ligase sina [Portunus trituberculatus]